MAVNEVAAAYVRLRPDASTFKADAQAQIDPQLRDIQDRINAMRTQADSLANRVQGRRAALSESAGLGSQAVQLGVIAARAGAVTAALYEVKQAFDAASSRETNLDLVEQSVLNAGQAWGLYGKQVTDALDKQRRDSGFALDEITQGFSRLETVVKNPLKALQDLAVAEDVARARGVSLEQVTSSIAQAAQGQFANLNQLGTVVHLQTTRVDELRAAHARLLDTGVKLTHVQQAEYQARLQAAGAADKQATAEEALNELAKRNAGQAKAYIDSTNGGISDLRTSVTELQEEIGGPLLTATNVFARAISGAIQGYLRYTSLVGQGVHFITNLFNDSTSSAHDFAVAVQEATTAGTRSAGLDQLVSLLREIDKEAQAAGHVGKSSVDFFNSALSNLAKQNPALAQQIEDIQGIAKAAGGLKNLSDIDIKIAINPQLDGTKLTAQIVQQIEAATTAAQSALEPWSRNGSITSDLLRGGFKEPDRSPKLFGTDNKIFYPPAVKEGAKKAAETWSTEFVTHIDASGIGDAISSALSDARSNIVTQSDAIASAVGDALDERLRRTTLPLTREIEALQASLDASSAAAAATDAADAVTAAQQKLAQLKSVYGTGALTAGQQGEINDAQKAVQDAQRQVQDQAKQAQIANLQGQIDAAGKAEDLRKSAVTRNLSDLADEFNRGKITQEKYLEGVRGILKDQQVDFKNAGQLLGTAFADGFKDALTNLSQQVLLLTGGQRKGSTLTKPTSVTKAGADATQAILDQIAQSGGRYTIDNASSLPKGVNVASLVAAAKRTRDEDSYRVSSTKAQQAQLVHQETANRHLETIADILRTGTHVVIDGSTPKKKTRATAKATQS